MSGIADSELYPFIYKRKAVRKFDMAGLEDAQLAMIQNRLTQLTPLYPHIKTEAFIARSEQVSNLLAAKAPWYLVIFSETKDGCLENVGFIYQQMDLYFSSLGLGSCWMSSAKPKAEIKSAYPFVFIIQFGKPINSPYRNIDEFKRKPLETIASGTDPRLEAARLAPSAKNSQMRYFMVSEGVIHVYKTNPGLIDGKMYDHMYTIDIGIALCHLYLASLELGMTFRYEKLEHAPEQKGHTYMGSVLA